MRDSQQKQQGGEDSGTVSIKCCKTINLEFYIQQKYP